MLILPNERRVGTGEIEERCCDLGEVLDELAVEVSETEEATKLGNVLGDGEVGKGPDLVLFNFNTVDAHDVTDEVDALLAKLTL